MWPINTKLQLAGKYKCFSWLIFYYSVELKTLWQYTIEIYLKCWWFTFRWLLLAKNNKKWHFEILVPALASLYYEKANQQGILSFFLPSLVNSQALLFSDQRNFSLLLIIITTQNTSNTLSIGEWQLRLVHHSPEPSPVTYTHAQHVSVHLGSYPSNFCRPAPFRQKDPGTRVWSQASQGQEESRPKPAGLALRNAREIESKRENVREEGRQKERQRTREKIQVIQGKLRK